MVIDFVLHHGGFFAGVASGFILSHLPLVVSVLFQTAMKVPQLKSLVGSNPEKAKFFVDTIARELDKDIDAEAAKVAPAVVPSAPPAPPKAP